MAGLNLTAERMSGRRHRVATVLVTPHLPDPVVEEAAPIVTPAAVVAALSDAVIGPAASSGGTMTISDGVDEES